jgi:predicted O-linked N-acetylglucosamine transferase (SPINDLY family)
MTSDGPPQTRAHRQQPHSKEDAAIVATLRHAHAHFFRGDPGQAERLCLEILATAPGCFEALHFLAGMRYQQGRYEEAVTLFQKAIEARPGEAYAYSNLGLAQEKLERLEQALGSYDSALAVQPDFADAIVNRGNALAGLGRLMEAIADYDRALALKPDHVEALYNRGNVLRKLGRNGDALSSYERALALKPDIAEALYNRGNVLRDLQRHEDAVASYDRALALQPAFADALYNRGIALREINRHEDALVSYDGALAIRPAHPEALNNRGNALAALKRYDEALAAYDGALAVNPRFAQALYNRGNALWELKRYPEAAATFSRLIALAPDHDFALGWLLTTRMQCCDWENAARETEHVTAMVERGERAILPFAFLAVSPSAPAHLTCARTYSAYKYPASPAPVWTGERYRHDKIRVAYLSADFHNHATAYLMAGLFEAHDKQRFDVVAVSFGPDARDEMRERLRRSFNRFVDVRRMGDREVARMLRTWEIDIAVDIKGFSNDCRTGILAHRPAPIQVNYLGWPATMGADYIDYIIADEHVVPLGHEAFYAEKVARLPDTYQVNDSKRKISNRTPSRAEVNLPDAGFVFCCFNNNYKIRPNIYDIWMRLLSKVPGSVLWLLEDNAIAAQNLRHHAEQCGVAAGRIVLAPRVAVDEHLARHRLADLFLDTLPCSAHTTASDALWAGLPVLTCMGTTFAGRVAGSLLDAVGLSDLITRSLEDYERMALKLATSPDMLSDIRGRLAQNRKTHPLFDTDLLRRHLELAYVTMWERYQRAEPAASFSVPRLQ